MKKSQKTLHLYKKVVSDLSVVPKGGLARKESPTTRPTNGNTMCYICPDHQNHTW
jgi:hypothetical protein